jgi:NADH-quinone oxidoreductase subunit J
MTIVFYFSALVAIVSTLLAITRRHSIHALLYLIVSFLAIAVIFYVLGAPFISALELIIYAGAIMVLFVFVVMMLNLGDDTAKIEREWLSPRAWIGPGVLAVVLLAEQAYLLAPSHRSTAAVEISPKQVSIALFGPYVIGVELASLLLMAGLVGAYHLGRRTAAQEEEMHGIRTARARFAAGGDSVRSGSDRTTHAA